MFHQVTDDNSPRPKFTLRNQCPKCRAKVAVVNRNTELGSVVADVLRVNGHQRRPQKELDELDRANKFDLVGELSYDVAKMHKEIVKLTSMARSRGRGRTPRPGGGSRAAGRRRRAGITAP
jgi:hypothetical protein